MILVVGFFGVVLLLVLWRRYVTSSRRVKDHVMPQMMINPTPRRRLGPMKSERL